MTDDKIVSINRWTDFNDAKPQKSFEDVPSTADVKARMLASIRSILGYLLPGGVIRGGVFHVGDLDGNPGHSLNIELVGSKAGLWVDHATGEGGDILDLWAIKRGFDTRRDFPALMEDAREWLGIATRTIHTDPRPTKKSPPVDELGPRTGIWRYLSPHGELLAEVYRYDPEPGRKEFRPWDAKARKAAAPTPRPLYNQPGVSESETVILVEGEKCAEALINAGVVATTAMNGAKSPVDKTDWSPLAGKSVLIWPDADGPGWEYADAASKAIMAAGATSCRILIPEDDRPKKWDAADAIAEGIDPRAWIISAAKDDVARDGSLEPLDFPFWQEMDLRTIPPIEFVYGTFFARGFTSLTVAPQKVGKSQLTLAEAVDMATGRGFLSGIQAPPLRVLYYNAEDNQDVVNSRVGAICNHYCIPQSEIAGRLAAVSGVGKEDFFLISGTDKPLINEQVFARLEMYVKTSRVDVLILDPLQDLSHATETNEVFRLLGQRLRSFTTANRVAVGLVHHTRKAPAGAKSSSIEDSRGGGALLGTSRANRVIVAMTEEEGEKANVDNYRSFFRLGDAETNLGPPQSELTQWFEKVSVQMPNGQSSPVVSRWAWPDAFDGISPEDVRRVQREIDSQKTPLRASPRAKAWVGYLVAEVLGMDADNPRDRARINTFIKTWVKADVLREGEERDTQKGRDVSVIVCGQNRMIEDRK